MDSPQNTFGNVSVDRSEENDKYEVLLHLDRDEGKLYIRVMECNVGVTNYGAPRHHILEGLTIVLFPSTVIDALSLK